MMGSGELLAATLADGGMADYASLIRPTRAVAVSGRDLTQLINSLFKSAEFGLQ